MNDIDADKLDRLWSLWYGIELPERPFDQPNTNWPISPPGTWKRPGGVRNLARVLRHRRAPTGYYFQPSSE